MRVLSLCILLFSAGLAHAGLKEQIAELEEAVKQEDAAGGVHADLALAYLKDQDQPKAFARFLTALEKTPPSTGAEPGGEEKRHYEEAMAVYLGEGTSKEIAAKIKEKYGELAKEHEDWHLLSYIVALAHANLGDYESFFSYFYRAYPHLPDHYLAHKTKAVLHIKLYEREGISGEKEPLRQKILASSIEALEKNPRDTVLYKWVLTFSRPEDRPHLTAAYLQKIVEQNILIPRADIGFYVQKAVETEQLALAERFVSKAREWYQYSRVVNAAQQYLDQKKRQP